MSTPERQPAKDLSGSAQAPAPQPEIMLERVRVRPLMTADLATLSPMLALAAAAGLVTPPPMVIAPPPATGEETDAADMPEHDEYWLADHDGRVIGFAVLHHVDRQRAGIRAIWVEDRCRRLGVGQRLLEGTVVHCQRAGYLKLVLELPFSLEKIVPLFGRLGFAFARRRAVNGNSLLEFYLDLYRDPGI